MKKGDHTLGEIEILQSDQVFQNQYMTVYNDQVIFPSGYHGTYLRMESPSPFSVGILPVREDGRFGLLQNYRHGARGWCLEMIKGGADGDETAPEACRREMEEESGLRAETLIEMGTFSDSPAVYTGLMHCYLAKGITAVPRKPENTEAISRILFFSPDEYFSTCRQMDFVDGMTELIIYKYMCIAEKGEFHG